ncbi:MAG: hypothetical protein A2W99_15440 [Bacteroidetes bacterium GWF2_33_16]|nr:MAG: hypothetical protein A2X00_09650 [Bacteroidetes bacterium GWE2_32_14]OFY07713.1 MAG: hypothetical protein A2W99_15440 [Bacteroidetes bacterium GWF2_33_16]
MKTSILACAILATILLGFTGCDEETLDLFTDESGVKDPVFDDSYGYLRAQKSGLPLNTEIQQPIVFH